MEDFHHPSQLPRAIRRFAREARLRCQPESENFDDVSNCLRYAATSPCRDGSNFGAIMCFEQCPRCESTCTVRCARLATVIAVVVIATMLVVVVVVVIEIHTPSRFGTSALQYMPRKLLRK